jgi:3-hydroxyacyl-CoA dehydrogenase
MAIRKVAVIGSGVMGSGIAAQIANAGVPVVLLDIVPKEAKDRSVLAKGAIEKMLKTEPAPFMHRRNAKLVTPGNLEDDLALLGECDWIIEVVLEDIAIKHKTYEKIAAHRRKGAIVSSNTSTIPLHNLVEPFGPDFARDFMITHFFNPPRYMRLLELVIGKDTRADAVREIREFCDVRLGKGVVECHDTPGFIANRLGVFWMQAALNEAIAQDVPVELVDAVMGKPAGIPKTGVFGLIDLVGIDLMPHLAESMLATLPADDRYRKIHIDHPFIHGMIAAGYTGRKGKGGFYRLKPGGKKEKEALAIDAARFDESQYRPAQKAAPDPARKTLRAVIDGDDAAGKFARAVMNETLAYAASLVPEIADTIAAVDEAMRLGYNWKQGPFELIDSLGPAQFAQDLKQAGIAVPELLEKLGAGTFYKVEGGRRHYFGTDGKYHPIERAEGVLLLADFALGHKPVLQNESANVWDIGDGVLCFEHRSKMNTFDDRIFALLEQVVETIGDGKGKYKALVVYNEGPVFSAGANLGLALEMIAQGKWQEVEGFIAKGQEVFEKLKFAPFPYVAAPAGLALGGGCEVLLHADHVQAHAETYCGLVEAGVGLVPSWGGCKEMLLRFRARQRARTQRLWFTPANDPMGAPREAFQLIALASVSKSAADAIALGYLRETDGITMNRDRLLFDAKQKALELAKGYAPPEEVEDMRLPGPSGAAALDMAVADMRKSGKATPYDVVVSGHLAQVLSGGETADWTRPKSERDIILQERHEFMKLLHNEGTIARIKTMLETGKPLRN